MREQLGCDAGENLQLCYTLSYPANISNTGSLGLERQQLARLVAECMLYHAAAYL